jgi:hypothetical protein
VLALEIAEELEAALEQFAEDFKRQPHDKSSFAPTSESFLARRFESIRRFNFRQLLGFA